MKITKSIILAMIGLVLAGCNEANTKKEVDPRYSRESVYDTLEKMRTYVIDKGDADKYRVDRIVQESLYIYDQAVPEAGAKQASKRAVAEAGISLKRQMIRGSKAEIDAIVESFRLEKEVTVDTLDPESVGLWQ